MDDWCHNAKAGLSRPAPCDFEAYLQTQVSLPVEKPPAPLGTHSGHRVALTVLDPLPQHLVVDAVEVDHVPYELRKRTPPQTTWRTAVHIACSGDSQRPVPS